MTYQAKMCDALAKLVELQPTRATLVHVDGEGNVEKEEVVEASLLKRGDIVRVSSDHMIVHCTHKVKNCQML